MCIWLWYQIVLRLSFYHFISYHIIYFPSRPARITSPPLSRGIHNAAAEIKRSADFRANDDDAFKMLQSLYWEDASEGSQSLR